MPFSIRFIHTAAFAAAGGLFAFAGVAHAASAPERGTHMSPVLQHDVSAQLDSALGNAGCPNPTVVASSVAYFDSVDLPWLEQWMVRACNKTTRWSIELIPTADGGADFTLEPPAPPTAFNAATFAAAHGGSLASPQTQELIVSKIADGSKGFDHCAPTIGKKKVVFFQSLFTTWFEHWTVSDCAKTRIWTVLQHLNAQGGDVYDVTTTK
jgi:hypothetical protein